MKNNKLKKILIFIISFIVILFITYKMIDIIFYDYMFVVDMSNSENYKLSNSYNNGVVFDLVKKGEYYETDVPDSITGYEINFKIMLNEEDNRIEKVIYNDKVLEDRNILKLTDYSKLDKAYENIPLFMINRDQTKKVAVSIVLSVIISVVLSIILNKEKDGENNIFSFSNSFKGILKKRDYLIVFLIFLITLFIVVGCDAKVIVNVQKLFAKDIDVYQLQVNTRLLQGREYAEFPYNPIMLFVWGGIYTLFKPIIQLLPSIGNYPYFEVGLIKIFNLIFICLTVSSIISYLLDKKIIDKKQAKWIWYMGILNPVTFYVAILFVQLDALTLFLITLGTLKLDNLNNNKLLGVVYLALGLTLKMQTILLMPIAIIAMTYLIFYCNKEKTINKIILFLKTYFVFFGIIIFTFVLPYIMKTPFYYLESNLNQSERMWFTIIKYSETILLYLTLAGLAVAMISYALSIHSKMKKENIILSSIIYYAVIVFVFSFTIMPTPSVYIITLGGFVIISALEKDKLKNIILMLVSIFVILSPMVSDYGDISKIFSNPLSAGKLSTFIQNSKESVKLNSIAFTISSSAMMIIALYFGKFSTKLLKEESELKQK